MQKSTVKWFDAKKGYGFIDHPSGGDDVFVHYSQVISTKDFKTLRTGQEVRFDLNDGPKGLHALDVKPLEEEEGEGTKKADTEGVSRPDDGNAPAPEAPAPAAAASETPAPEASSASEAPAPEASSASEAPAPEASSASEAPAPEASSASEAPAPEASSASERSSVEVEDESSSGDDWEWDEDWTDEHGNPPDPMASPSF